MSRAIAAVVLLSMSVSSAGPVEEAELVKVLSKSPDGNVEIVTIVPKGETEESFRERERIYPCYENYAQAILSGIYIRDKRNKGDALPVYKAGYTPYRGQPELTWAGDSSWLSIYLSDEKDAWANLFARRYDERKNLWSYQEPVFPDLEEIIRKNTRENGAIFDPCPRERAVDALCFNWGQGPPDDIAIERKDGRFSFEMSLRELSINSDTATDGQHYRVRFETSDWIKFELKRIERSGRLISGSYHWKDGFNDPVVMYPERK